MRRPVPTGVAVVNGRVEITLDAEGAEWLASELPQSDGFTRDLQDVVAQLRVDEAHRAEEPGIGIRIAILERPAAVQEGEADG